MLTHSDHTTAAGVRIQKTVFTNGAKEKEIHLLLSLAQPSARPFPVALAALIAESSAQAAQEQTAIVFQRFLVSAAHAQHEAITAAAAPLAALSIIEQPPADGAPVALWVYLSNQTHYTQRWATQLTAPGGDAQEQTERLFDKYISLLSAQRLTLAAHCQRTWLFVADIDHRYAAMVAGRNATFDRQGLTAQTHYIASTGIAGSAANGAYVAMDAVAYALPPEKIRYLYGSSHLNRTSDYGVRFERGVALTLPYATQVFISGTASINNRGEVVAAGDVLRQAERMMSNVSTLLAEAQCAVDDIQQALIYLRHPADYQRVEEWFAAHYPRLPRLLLHAAVCRQQWLIEIECMAMR